MNNTWKVVRSIYTQKLNISSDLLYLMSDYDIIKLCAVGLSNESVSRILNVDLQSVKKSIRRHLLFSGYKEDLDLNPYEIYLRVLQHGYNKESFFDEILILSSLIKEKDLERVYNVCRIFKELEERIEKEWN